MSHDPIVIISPVRTPIGGLLGILKDVEAPALGAKTIKASLKLSGVEAEAIDETYMGCVLTAGLRQAPARQASIGAGLTDHTACTTVSKVCGSGLKAVMLGHDAIAAGSANIIMAGGMESMSNAPYLLRKARQGYRLGNDNIYDHMFLDGLEDAYSQGTLMGCFAEKCAQHYQFTREAQDAFALTSLERAQRASADGSFDHEIISITIKGKKQNITITQDEQPQKANPEKIPTLKPAFANDGTVTAANASSISDGAASMILMRASDAEKRGLNPIARILGHSSYASAPEWFATAPIKAMEQVSAKTGISLNDIDLFEINEAFAVVTMAAMHDLNIPHDKVNINGGACALGHPIGASGARILVTLLHALTQHEKQYGMASLCIGGGEAVAMAVERIN